MINLSSHIYKVATAPYIIGEVCSLAHLAGETCHQLSYYQIANSIAIKVPHSIRIMGFVYDFEVTAGVSGCCSPESISLNKCRCCMVAMIFIKLEYLQVCDNGVLIAIKGMSSWLAMFASFASPRHILSVSCISCLQPTCMC